MISSYIKMRQRKTAAAESIIFSLEDVVVAAVVVTVLQT